MRTTTNINLILPESMSMESFREIMSKALKESSQTWPANYCDPDTKEWVNKVEQVNKYELDVIYGNEAMSFELKKRSGDQSG